MKKYWKIDIFVWLKMNKNVKKTLTFKPPQFFEFRGRNILGVLWGSLEKLKTNFILKKLNLKNVKNNFVSKYVSTK